MQFDRKFPSGALLVLDHQRTLGKNVAVTVQGQGVFG